MFVSSLSGKSAGPHSSLYSATKFGLRGFSLGLRQDLAEHGVGVSCVFPGFVRDAGMFADSGATLPPGVGHEHARGGRRRRSSARSSATGRRSTSPRWGCRPARGSAGVAPALTATVQGRLGSFKVARAIGAGQRDKR